MAGRVKLSVIMPVYNAARTLERAVQSVLGQGAELELIAVDDGSTDESGQLLRQMAGRDARLQPVFLSENVGPARARGVGLRISRGEWVHFCDADDFLCTGAYHALLEATGGPVDAVVFGARELGAGGEILRLPPECLSEGPRQIGALCARLEAQTLWGYLWNKLYRRDFLMESALFLEPFDLYEDAFFNFRCFQRMGSVRAVAKALYVYDRRGAGHVTNRPHPDYFGLSRRRIECAMEALSALGALDDGAMNVLARRYGRYAASALMRRARGEIELNVGGMLEGEPMATLRPHMRADGWIERLLLWPVRSGRPALCRAQGWLLAALSREALDKWKR